MSIPSQQDRPDLYDAFDGIDRPEGWENTISTPEHLQRLLAAKRRDKDEGVNVYFIEELRRQTEQASNEPSDRT